MNICDYPWDYAMLPTSSKKKMSELMMGLEFACAYIEATGAEKVVLDCFCDEKTGSYIKMLVMDDDSSTKSKLVHPFGVAVELGHFEEWPTYENSKGKKGEKKINGVLPTNHPKIEFLADKNHRVRCYGKTCGNWRPEVKNSHR
jgi:hypothetical protein